MNFETSQFLGVSSAAPESGLTIFILFFIHFFNLFGGESSGGLDTTGGSSDGCDSSTGQIYTRAATYEEYFAIMYSW